MEILVFETAGKASAFAAEKFIEQISQKPNSLLGMATGGTVVSLYQKIIEAYQQKRVSFASARTVNLDEYVGLSPDNAQSYAYYMYSKLFDHIDLPKENIFLLDGLGVVDSELKRFNEFLLQNPIDLQLLGIGTNGHIGFNEPSSQFQLGPHLVDLAEETIKSNSRFFKPGETMPTQAISMGIRDIMLAGKVLLLAFGKAKADAICKMVNSTTVDPMLPVSVLNLRRNVTIVLDKELAQAAGL